MTKDLPIKKGTIARYTGTAHVGLKNAVVKVVSLILDDDWNPTGDYEVQVWSPKQRRWSWVTYDAGPEELKVLPPSQAARYQRNDPPHTLITKVAKPGEAAP